MAMVNANNYRYTINKIAFKEKQSCGFLTPCSQQEEEWYPLSLDQLRAELATQLTTRCVFTLQYCLLSLMLQYKYQYTYWQNMILISYC